MVPGDEIEDDLDTWHQSTRNFDYSPVPVDSMYLGDSFKLWYNIYPSWNWSFAAPVEEDGEEFGLPPDDEDNTNDVAEEEPEEDVSYEDDIGDEEEYEEPPLWVSYEDEDEDFLSLIQEEELFSPTVHEVLVIPAPKNITIMLFLLKKLSLC